MTGSSSWHLVRAALLAGATTGAVQHALLLAGWALPGWLLPIAFAAILLLTRRQPDTTANAAPPPRWLTIATAATLATCFAALAYGAIATTDRSWDGVVAWGMKAQALQTIPSLAQPLFADATILHHSPDYPLLQPLLLQDLSAWLGPRGARLLFPAMWALLTATTALTTLRAARSGTAACLIAVAVGTLPCFVNCGGGAADSGYAELLMALVVLGGAVALHDDDAPLMAAAAMALPWCKPEGTVVLFALLTVCFAGGNRRVWLAALLGGAIGLSLWLPLQMQLGYRESPLWLVPAGWAIAAAAAAARAMLDRLGVPARGRLLALGLLFAGAIVATLAAQSLLANTNSPLLSHYLGSLSRIPEKLTALPTICTNLLGIANRPNRFGLTFVALVIAIVIVARTRKQPEVGKLLPVLGWLSLGITAILAAFLLSPEPNVEHHLRSSAARLLSQWGGVAWLAIGLTWARPTTTTSAPASS